MSVSLQLAFDGGTTIDESTGAHAGDPVAISNGGAAIGGGALLQLTADANMLALILTQQAAAPAMRALMATGLTAQPAYDAESDSLNQVVVRLHQTADDLYTYLHGKGLVLAGGASALDVVEVAIEAGSNDVSGPQLRLATGNVATGSAAADLSLGFVVDGNPETNLNLQGSTGKVQVRPHNIGDTGAPVNQGALTLPSLSSDEADAQIGAAEDGDLLFVSSSEGTAQPGANLYRGATYAQLARLRTVTFTAGDIVANVVALTHDLNCTKLLWVVYDDTGTAVNPDLVLTYQETSSSGGNLTISPTLTVSGTWSVTFVGY